MLGFASSAPTYVLAQATLAIYHRGKSDIGMDGRRIVERGTHREMLAKQGANAQMWALQRQEEE
jgi:ABC-type multidrug transport system fused ATPase/permease subunit